MKYQRAIDVTNLPTECIAVLQPGQWVYTGSHRDPNTRGRFLGVKASGTVVVAWQGNARGRGPGGHRDYTRALRDFALGDRPRSCAQ